MTNPARMYRCTNPQCERFDVKVRVDAVQFGTFWSWPPLTCDCGFTPICDFYDDMWTGTSS